MIKLKIINIFIENFDIAILFKILENSITFIYIFLFYYEHPLITYQSLKVIDSNLTLFWNLTK